MREAAERGAVALHYTVLEPPPPLSDSDEEEATEKGWGTEPACPVIILHGLLGSSRNFAGWAKALSESLRRRRRIVMPDLRNHGDSPQATSMGYVTMAGDVIALLDALGIERCCLIGHSMGGKVAAALALLYPERVDSVAVLDIAPVSYSGQHGPASATTWREIHGVVEQLYRFPAHEVRDRRHADQLLSESIPDPALRAFALTNLAPSAEGGWRWKVGLQSIWRNMGIIGGFDLGQGLLEPASLLGRQFPRDAFFLQGGRSKFIRSAHLEEVGRLFPKFVVQSMRNAGHWIHSEDPQASLENVRRFLDRSQPTPFDDDL